MATQTITLDGDTDWPGFRREARGLLARQVPPDDVVWHTRDSAELDLFASLSDESVPPASLEVDAEDAAASVATVRASSTPHLGSASAVVPPAFVRLCETVVLHEDPARFGLLYRLLWRLVHEPGLRDDPIDADRVRAQHMAQAVRRDMHKMKAFVRFRTIEQADGGATLHVAWFEPFHHIVEAVAPFFVRRFTQMRWAILTPERSLRWEPAAAGREGTLTFGPGARREDAPPADAGEALWLTYYCHIFNPARLKLAMMQKEMPRRYWRNLPEAELITPLSVEAMARSGRMIEAPASTPARRIAPVPHPRERATRSTREVASPDLVAAASPLVLSDEPARALVQLKEATQRCRECPIGAHATQAVFGEGPVRSALMVVGEQPGDQEDLRGRPFVGPSGRLFDRAVADLGWTREAIYVTNAVKHFKFELRGKRRIHKTPTQQEAATCLHWLESEMRQVQPRALVALGATAARALLGRPVAVMKERGQWHTGPHGEQVLVTLHPSALLRGDPAQHEEAYARWLEDLALASTVVNTTA
ncbi:MAG TPA: UdgX family uracil-DNA binding protein [Variovorax sp.]|nr:UdgX family uracil-DNA binding protein [Variovorax sp.]